MRFPCESVVKQFLTAYRHALIKTLKDGGKTQQQIADMLYLTQAAVSNYLKRDATGMDFPGMEQVIEDLARRSAGLIEDGGIVPVMDMVCHACKVHRFPNQPFCTRHAAEIPALDTAGCTICSKYLDPDVVQAWGERGTILHELVIAARDACALQGFASLVPEVQANFVLGTEAPGKDVGDYAAFPGRIVKIDDVARPIGSPAFGASTHLARIVMLVRERHPAVRSAICLRYGPDVDGAMIRAGLAPVRLQDESDRDGIAREIQRASEPCPDALTFAGAVGLEPLSYVLGATPAEVVAKVRRLLAQLRA